MQEFSPTAPIPTFRALASCLLCMCKHREPGAYCSDDCAERAVTPAGWGERPVTKGKAYLK